MGKALESILRWGPRPGAEWGMEGSRAEEWCAGICVCENTPLAAELGEDVQLQGQ